MTETPIRCFGRKFDRHDPRPMAHIEGGDVYRCPACESRVEVRETAA